MGSPPPIHHRRTPGHRIYSISAVCSGRTTPPEYEVHTLLKDVKVHNQVDSYTHSTTKGHGYRSIAGQWVWDTEALPKRFDNTPIVVLYCAKVHSPWAGGFRPWGAKLTSCHAKNQHEKHRQQSAQYALCPFHAYITILSAPVGLASFLCYTHSIVNKIAIAKHWSILHLRHINQINYGLLGGWLKSNKWLISLKVGESVNLYTHLSFHFIPF